MYFEIVPSHLIWHSKLISNYQQLILDNQYIYVVVLIFYLLSSTSHNVCLSVFLYSIWNSMVLWIPQGLPKFYKVSAVSAVSPYRVFHNSCRKINASCSQNMIIMDFFCPASQVSWSTFCACTVLHQKRVFWRCINFIDFFNFLKGGLDENSP